MIAAHRSIRSITAAPAPSITKLPRNWPIRPQGGALQTVGVQPLDGKIVNGIDDHAHGRNLGKGARAVNGAPALNFPPTV